MHSYYATAELVDWEVEFAEVEGSQAGSGPVNSAEAVGSAVVDSAAVDSVAGYLNGPAAHSGVQQVELGCLLGSGGM